MQDVRVPRNKVAFSQYPKGKNLGTAMRTDRYRYVEWTDKSGKVVDRELYDHQADPAENENRANRPEYAKTMEELARQFQNNWKADRTKY